MAMKSFDQTNVGASVYNFAVGHISTDAVGAVAQTIQLGFLPRKIKVVNLTDRIVDEWYEDMGPDNLEVAIAGIAAHLDADATVADTDYAALWGLPTPVASNVNAPPVAANVDAVLPGLVKQLAGLTKKLDADSAVTGTDYFSLWGHPAANQTAIKAAIVGLALKLDNDTGVGSTDYTSGFVTSILSITSSLHTVANGTVTLELVNGIAVDDDPSSATFCSFTLTATTMVASKEFYWEAQA